jgi:hypothetical protein
MQRIAQNAMQYQQSMMMGMMGMPGMSVMGGGVMPGATPAAQQGSDNLGGSTPPGESSITRNARERVAESGSPT